MTARAAQEPSEARGGMTVFRAAWVCPIAAPPIANGWIAVADGRITACGRPADASPAGARIRDLGRVAVLPGLVNAHTHLELSWLRDRVPPAANFLAWLGGMFAVRGGAVEKPDDPKVLDAARVAAREAHEAGTIAVGDISNSLASVGPIADAGLSGIVFHELLGFSDTTAAAIERTQPARDAVALPESVRVSLAPHAAYSTSPELFRAVRQRVDGSELRVSSVHIGESPEEMEMLVRGTGSWPALLKRLGVWRADWTPPGSGPVEYLDAFGWWRPGTLAVHGVQLSAESLATLAQRECVLVTCPRSNQWVGVGVPPIARFYAAGVAVAIGTDSLASVADLNLFAELKEMRWLAPDVPAARFLESATLVGARALRLDADLGTIEPGKRAALIGVALPDDVTDIEEHLVSGIEASRVQWVSA